MNIQVSETEKVVAFWLSKVEKADDNFRETLKPQYSEWKKKGYTVAVFLSGNGDLCANTESLLLNNKNI